jgi:hypothetical protein
MSQMVTYDVFFSYYDIYQMSKDNIFLVVIDIYEKDSSYLC